MLLVGLIVAAFLLGANAASHDPTQVAKAPEAPPTKEKGTVVEVAEAPKIASSPALESRDKLAAESNSVSSPTQPAPQTNREPSDSTRKEEVTAGAGPETPTVPNAVTPAAATEPPPETESTQDSTETTKPEDREKTKNSGGHSLNYRWEKGEDYEYELSLIVERERRPLTMTGLLDYDVVDSLGARLVIEKDRDKATGTGFVVSKDGHLVTCAHVIGHNKSVEVTLQGKKFSAEVLSIDETNDLALIRIKATGRVFHPLGLAREEEVELGQSVRAVGYPLSDVLGDSVKITQGSIAGTVLREGKKLLQLDASINPGNSGGPVLDSTGRVVGVASAKLSGAGISNIGFAVPVEMVHAFLTANRISIPAPENGTHDLNGPQLAKKATPGVAFLEVRDVVPQLAGKQRFNLLLKTFINSGQVLRFDSRGQFAVQPQIEDSQIKLQVDEFGGVAYRSRNDDMLDLFGDLALLAIEPLPADGANTWTRKDVIGHGLDPSNVREQVTNFSIKSTSKDAVVIEKKYTMTIKKQGSPQPETSVTGIGTVHFDSKAGAITEVEWKGSVKNFFDGGHYEMPFSIELKRRSAEAIANRQKETAKILARSRMTPRERLKEAIEKLQNADTPAHEKIMALGTLSSTTPDSSLSKQVIAIAKSMLDDGSPGTSSTAVRVLARWGGDAAVGTLIDMLKSKDFSGRTAALSALADTKSRKAAEAIGDLIENSDDVSMSSIACSNLGRMGEVAEPVALKLISTGQSRTRASLCSVLGQAGGRKSLTVLRKLEAGDPDQLVRLTARSAITSIESRVGR